MDDENGPTGDSGEERSTEVRKALLKALAVIVVIGVVIALGTVIVVRLLGLNDSDSPGPVGAAPSPSVRPLPTTALPGPSDSADADPSASASASASASPTPSDGVRGDLELQVSPTDVRPGERVNLTGSLPGGDNQALEVQRFEDGAWVNFGVQATVRGGSFATYVQTQRPGEQRFRVFDPKTKKGSNVVLVTIG